MIQMEENDKREKKVVEWNPKTSLQFDCNLKGGKKQLLKSELIQLKFEIIERKM